LKGCVSCKGLPSVMIDDQFSQSKQGNHDKSSHFWLSNWSRQCKGASRMTLGQLQGCNVWTVWGCDVEVQPADSSKVQPTDSVRTQQMDSAKEQPVHGVSLHESTWWRGGMRLLDDETMGQHKAWCLVERRQDGMMAILCGEVGASGSGPVQSKCGSPL
jgi:hypothetical protein